MKVKREILKDRVLLAYYISNKLVGTKLYILGRNKPIIKGIVK